MRATAFANRAPRVAVAPRSNKRVSRAVVTRAGFFDFLNPVPATTKTNPRAAELVDEIVDTVSNPKADVDSVEELVNQLAPFGVKNPVRSNLLWGDFELLYTSTPGVLGAVGPKAVQSLEKPDLIENFVVTKAFLSDGYTKQSGTLKLVSGDTFVYTLRRSEVKSGFAGPKVEEINVEGKVQVLYLDDTLRIVAFAPLNEDGEELDESLLVFRRIVQEVEEDAEEEDPEEEGSKPAGGLFSFGRPAPSLATVAERQVKQESGGSRKQAVVVAPQKAAPQKAAPVKETKESREALMKKANEERALAKKQAEEAAAKKKAEEAAAREKAEKERAIAKQKAEEERQKEREKQQAIREVLAELAEELKEKQAAVREASNELRDVQKSNAAILKQVAQARAKIDAAAAETDEVEKEFAEVVETIKQQEAALKAAQQEVSSAQAELKRLFVTK